MSGKQDDLVWNYNPFILTPLIVLGLGTLLWLNAINLKKINNQTIFFIFAVSTCEIAYFNFKKDFESIRLKVPQNKISL
jgi:hypothetical protein